MKSNTLYWRINEQIRSDKLRLIGADGKQVGVVTKIEALTLSKKAGLTLVEIAPNSVPPVAKIVDFGKFRYSEEKKLKKQKKGAKASELKEIRLSPFIAEHDYQVRLDRIKEFLQDKNKVKVVVVFKGRQMGSKRFGYELINKVIKDLGNSVAVDMEAKFIGRHLITIVSPTNKSIQENTK